MSNTNNTMQTQTSNALHNAIMEAGDKDRPAMLALGNYNPPYKFKWTEKTVPVAEGSSETTTEGYMENYKNVSQDIRDQLNAEAEAVQIILTGIDNDIYSTVDACPNACEMWKAIERLKQGESINVQDLETNLYWEFGKFTSRDGESLESYYSRFVTLVKQSQELKTVSYYKLYDILKQHQSEVNEIIAERLAQIEENQLLTLLHLHQEPTMVAEDDEISKEKEIDKLMALISLSFKKIYKPTNNNLRTSSNTSRANQDNTSRINKGTREYGHVSKECQNQNGQRMQLITRRRCYCELEAHYMYMAKIQEVAPDAADNSGPIFDVEQLKKVQNDDDNYNVFDNDREHPEQPESVNEPYPVKQDEHNIIIDSLDMSYDREQDDQDDTDDLAKERDLLASLIEKLKCEIDDSKNRNKFLELSNKALVDKLKSEIEDFKTKNKSLESSNNHFKEANNELSKTNQLMFKDLKKFHAELDRYHDVNYASKVEIDYMKKELFAHQETISIMSQEKEAQTKFHKTRDDKELEKIIALENKIKDLDDIVYKTGCYNDNITLMLTPESDETIRLAQEIRSKLSDLIRPFDYDKLNNIYDLFIPQREKSPEQQYFSERSKMSHTSKEMVADLRYFNSLEHEVDSLKSQLETQKTQFLNEIDRLSREYYYDDHMNAILGVYTTLNEFTDFQCDYVDQVVKCEHLEKQLSKRKTMSKSFEALQKHAIDLELALQQ
ncbi:hypothetical protein Tco_0535198 [Tanacetum coccineum]